MTEDGTSSSLPSNTHNSSILSFFLLLHQLLSLPPLVKSLPVFYDLTGVFRVFSTVFTSPFKKTKTRSLVAYKGSK